MRWGSRHRGLTGALRAGAFAALTVALTGVAAAQGCRGGGGGTIGGGAGAAGGGIGGATGGAGGTVDLGAALRLARMAQQAQQARAAMIMQARQAEFTRDQQIRAAEAARFERFKEMRQAARRRPQIRPAHGSGRSDVQVSEEPATPKRWGYVVFGQA